MIDFVISTNSDGRVEAFYIDDTSTVMHTWQENEGEKLVWSKANALYGTAANSPNDNKPLTNVMRVETCTDLKGQIQVIAVTKDFKYYICYQTPGFWNGWYEIEQK